MADAIPTVKLAARSADTCDVATITSGANGIARVFARPLVHAEDDRHGWLFSAFLVAATALTGLPIVHALDLSSLDAFAIVVFAAAVQIAGIGEIQLVDRMASFLLTDAFIISAAVALTASDYAAFALAAGAIELLVMPGSLRSWKRAVTNAASLEIYIGLAMLGAMGTHHIAPGLTGVAAWSTAAVAAWLVMHLFTYTLYPLSRSLVLRERFSYRAFLRSALESEIVLTGVVLPFALGVVLAQTVVTWAPLLLVAPIVALAYLAHRGQRLHEAERALARALEAASTDSLTGLMSRGRFVEIALQQLAGAARHGYRVSLILADLDDFKSVNDERGHLAGDRVLKASAAALRESVGRLSDVVGRLGGEEFVALLPHTPADGCATVAERLRALVERTGITVSVGIASYEPQAPDNPDPTAGDASGPGSLHRVTAAYVDASQHLEQLIECADSAMYAAKRAGKNRVCVWSGPEEVAAAAPQNGAPRPR